jgi:4-hydroxy-4-methyl-2-oxoglutarate aldolase
MDREQIRMGELMQTILKAALLGCLFASTVPLVAQVKMTQEQMMFYTSEWKGDRFPDGRPKIADSLLTRALDVSIEDVWDYRAVHASASGHVSRHHRGRQG